MLSPSRFESLQKIFFKKITSCCNPSTVTFKFVKISSSEDFYDFTGDSDRVVDKTLSLKCLYTINLTQKQREKFGVSEDVSTVIYISPLELKAKYGESKFPDYILNSYSQIAVEFIGKHHEIESIKELEPMFNGNEYTCIAYQVNLKGDTGNIDIN